MIYNSTYSNEEKEIETDNLLGKKYNLIQSIRFGGIGSRRLIVSDLSINFKKIIHQKNDIIYSNIELRNKGIIIYISEGQKRFTWAIPFYKLVIYKTPYYYIHSDGEFVKFSNKLNMKESTIFYKKILKHKNNFIKHQNFV